MTCAVCHQRDATIGLLCDDCQDDVSAPIGMVPQQILATVAKRSDAALIDRWGRAHPLESRAIVGRNVEGSGIMILEGSISRHHAHLTEDRERGAWTLRDLGSSNGTFLNEVRVLDAAPLAHGDRIAIGHVDFYFVLGAAGLPEVRIDPSVIATIQPTPRAQVAGYIDADAAAGDFAVVEDTDVGIPTLDVHLVEPTGGGGGLLDVGELQVQLTTTQFELIEVLIRRMIAEAGLPAQVRGFVRSSELLGMLSWETHDPEDTHVKQLVRRLRRSMIRAGIGDLIESRHRFGYRLRVIPTLS